MEGAEPRQHGRLLGRVGADDDTGRGEIEAAAEDGGGRQRSLLGLVETLPRQGQRLAQRALAAELGGRRDVEQEARPRQQLVGLHHGHEAGDQLDGERQTVQAPDELEDRRVRDGGATFISRGPGALEEELHRGRVRADDVERLERELRPLLQASGTSRREQDVEIVGDAKHLGDRRRRRRCQLVATVEDDEHGAAGLERPPELRAVGYVSAELQRSAQAVQERVVGGDPGEIAPPHASREVTLGRARELQRQAGLADARRSGHRDEPALVEQPTKRRELFVAGDERGRQRWPASSSSVGWHGAALR